MGNKILPFQECGTLNRVFAAYFINKCYVAHGIIFGDYKPVTPQIMHLNEGEKYFIEGDYIQGLKHFFHGRVEITDFDLDRFRSIGIADFMDDEITDPLNDVARYFSNEVNSYKYCDFVFSSLHDMSPYIYDCILDPESNFRSRLTIAHDMASSRFIAIWEFYCLLVSKFREVEPHPIYGKSYKDVDHMTDEEREKYNKTSENEEND